MQVSRADGPPEGEPVPDVTDLLVNGRSPVRFGSPAPRGGQPSALSPAGMQKERAHRLRSRQPARNLVPGVIQNWRGGRSLIPRTGSAERNLGVRNRRYRPVCCADLDQRLLEVIDVLGGGPGPAAYSGACGDETLVVRLHSGNDLHEEMDRRAIECFDLAMQDVGLDAAGPLRQMLHDYFARATTTTMPRYHESAN